MLILIELFFLKEVLENLLGDPIFSNVTGSSYVKRELLLRLLMISILLQLGGSIMNSIDFTPLYRSSIGFDRLASLLDNALTTDNVSAGYPPYNIEVVDDNRYAISLALAGFEESDLDIKVEKNVLTVRGDKADSDGHRYLHQGIANRSFERKFNLADYVEVTDAVLKNGLLTISLVKEIPEAMKPRNIAINQASDGVLEHQKDDSIESKSKVA
jgi:molecular chaperone IbpA